MTVVLPRESKHWPSPGTWTFVRSRERVSGTNPGKRGTPTARVACAKCGQSAPIWFHEIDAEGNVTPSLVCPMDGCDWHVTVMLQGWKEAIA